MATTDDTRPSAQDIAQALDRQHTHREGSAAVGGLVTIAMIGGGLLLGIPVTLWVLIAVGVVAGVVVTIWMGERIRAR